MGRSAVADPLVHIAHVEQHRVGVFDGALGVWGGGNTGFRPGAGIGLRTSNQSLQTLRVRQDIGHQRRRNSDFVSFVVPVHSASSLKQVFDVKSFFRLCAPRYPIRAWHIDDLLSTSKLDGTKYLMRLVSWNLGHQCREDPIPAAFLAAVEALAPDVLSLNEYVHGPTRTELTAGLSDIGLPHFAVSDRLNGHNQILVASRSPLEAGSLKGPCTEGHGGASNFLHVRLPLEDLDFVGVRAPAYTGAALQDYWSKLLQIIRGAHGHRILFMGDFNTDPDQAKRATARHLQALKNEGWSVPAAEGPWSFTSKAGQTSRIDHAVVSRQVLVERAQYVREVNSILLAAPGRYKAVSDHTPLVLEIGGDRGAV